MKILLFLTLLSAALLQAQLSPGDLAEVHSKYEGLDNCNKCHSSELGIDPGKCLDCHQPLAERIQADKGLHANPGYVECQSCHVDHLGRDNKLIWWKNGIKEFDHQQTGYVLEGAHSAIACDKCHQEKNITDKAFLKNFSKDLGRTFLGLSNECLTCHEDAHKGQVSSNCISCHTMKSWKPATNFDHNTARFKLTGAHLNVSCDKCHLPKQAVADKQFLFSGLKFEACIDCHRDPHEDRFGRKCENCHSTPSWKALVGGRFNHNLTAYPLQGAHKSVQCSKCHVPGQPIKPLAHANCIDCHSDFHQRQFLIDNRIKDCKYCHSLATFSPSNYSVEQHQKTNFQLRGAHLATPCVLCHSASYVKYSGKATIKFTFADQRCIGCHENIHGNIPQKYISGDDCTSCHREEGWDQIRFDHNQTTFSLSGRHQYLKCSDCHQKFSEINGKSLALTGLSGRCISCHEDQHAGQFIVDGEVDCGRCHVAEDWLAEKFDHNRDSRFAIRGGHVNVPCESCHKPESIEHKIIIRYKPLKYDCADCHEPREEKKS